MRDDNYPKIPPISVGYIPGPNMISFPAEEGQRIEQENVIASLIHGSYMYGTHVDESDVDVVVIYVDDYYDAIDGDTSRRSRTIIQPTGTELDVELIEFSEFITKLIHGDVQMLEHVFTPKECKLYTSEVWDDLIEPYRDRFISARCFNAFEGIAHGQLQDDNTKRQAHGLRVLKQFRELVETGTLTFPLQEADVLRDARLNGLAYEVTDDTIETAVNFVKAHHQLCQGLGQETIRDEPDLLFAQTLKRYVYREQHDFMNPYQLFDNVSELQQMVTCARERDKADDTPVYPWLRWVAYDASERYDGFLMKDMYDYPDDTPRASILEAYEKQYDASEVLDIVEFCIDRYQYDRSNRMIANARCERGSDQIEGIGLSLYCYLSDDPKDDPRIPKHQRKA